MRQFPLLIIAAFSLGTVGCSQMESSSENYDKMTFTTEEGGFQRADSPLEAEEMEQSASTEIAEPINRKLIWTADLEFQVKNVDESTRSITQLSKKYDGFISNMELNSNNYRVSNTITLRVKNEHFNALISEIKGEAVFTDRANISSNDVTEEFIDIQSRLKTKREVRERYIEILRTKTGDIKDVIAAEEAIRTITEEIEAKEGRLRYLQNKVDLSTITMEIYETVDYVAEPDRYEKPYSEEMGESFSSGWSAIKAIFLGLITIWPLLLILFGLAFWKRKWIVRLFKGKKTS